MSLYLVSGTAGTGKTAVCHELKARGYEAYDTDDDGLARWQHNQTGYIHPKSSVKAHQRTPEFLDDHSWNVPRDYVEKLARKSEDRSVFVCGSLGNERGLRDLFATVFALYVDDETLVHRLVTRTGNDWGKQPHELQLTLEHNRQELAVRSSQGDVVVDASQPVENVVDIILAACST